MQKEMERKKANNVALLIGLALIILTVLITFIRPYLGKRTRSTPISKENQASSKKSLITSDDLSSRINDGQKIALVDIRSKEDFQKEHLPGSMNIPAGSILLSLGSIPKEQPVILIDDGISGQAFDLAENVLPDKGYPDVLCLDGGFPAWKINFGATVSEGEPTSIADQSKVNYISSDQLKALMASRNDLYIIDVRKENSYRDGHLEGAINIFLDDLESRKDKLPLNKRILLYDNDGLWAFKGAVRLFDLGIPNPSALSDGLDGWKKKGYPVIR